MTNEKAIMCLEDMRIKVPIPKAAKQARENNEALDVAIKALKNEPHWMPVTERLPDVGVDGEIEILGYEQLAIADSTFKISNPVLATRKIDDRYELAVLQWEVDGNDRKYWVNDGGDIIKGVIAWMPLPEPFKGVNT